MRPLVGLLVAAQLLVACTMAPAAAEPTTTLDPTRMLGPTAEPARPAGWVSVGEEHVAFLQWTWTGETLSGSMTIVAVTGPFDHQPTDLRADVSGVADGEQVTLSFFADETGSETVSGELRGNRLTLAYPEAGGAIATLVFVPGGVDDYNDALTAFRATEESELMAQLEKEAAAAAEEEERMASDTCSVTVVGHHATIIAVGIGAASECAELAAFVQLPDYDSWGEVQSPWTAPEGTSTICDGDRDGYSIAVYDTGGAYYGGLACDYLFPGPWLGVWVTETPDGLLLEAYEHPDTGSYEAAVIADSPADRAGLQDGDIIESVDGTRVPTSAALDAILASRQSGDVLVLSVLRNGGRITVELTLEPRPAG